MKLDRGMFRKNILVQYEQFGLTPEKNEVFILLEILFQVRTIPINVIGTEKRCRCLVRSQVLDCHGYGFCF